MIKYFIKLILTHRDINYSNLEMSILFVYKHYNLRHDILLCMFTTVLVAYQQTYVGLNMTAIMNTFTKVQWRSGGLRADYVG